MFSRLFGSSELTPDDEQKVNALCTLVEKTCRSRSMRGDQNAEDQKAIAALKAVVGIHPKVKTRVDELQAAYLRARDASSTTDAVGDEVGSWLVGIADTVLVVLRQDPSPRNARNTGDRVMAAEEKARQSILSNTRLKRDALIYALMQSYGLKRLWRRTSEEARNRPKYYPPPIFPFDGRSEIVRITKLEAWAAEEFERTHLRPRGSDAMQPMQDPISELERQALLLTEQQRWAEARELWSQAFLRQMPPLRKVEILKNVALTYDREHMYPEAIKTAEEAIQLIDAHGLAKGRKGRSLRGWFRGFIMRLRSASGQGGPTKEMIRIVAPILGASMGGAGLGSVIGSQWPIQGFTIAEEMITDGRYVGVGVGAILGLFLFGPTLRPVPRLALLLAFLGFVVAGFVLIAGNAKIGFISTAVLGALGLYLFFAALGKGDSLYRD
jgi:tetratricopeptide (TPR) repeat protein